MTEQPLEANPAPTANTNNTSNDNPIDAPIKPPCNVTTLDPNDSFTEGHHHWRPQKVFPLGILTKSNHWPKLHTSKPPMNETNLLSLRMDQQKLFGDLLQDDMHNWTSFHYMGMLEQELLWLLEMSDLFKLKHQTNIEYMRQYMSPTLSEFVDKGKIESVDRLIREFFASLSPNIKMEFIAKRKKAKGAILKKIQLLRNLLADDAKSLSDLYASGRWILFEKDSSLQGVLKRNDIVYVAEYESLSTSSSSSSDEMEECNVQFYSGKILGVKMVGDQVIYYTVFMDNATVEKVRQESLLTGDEMDVLSQDVEMLMKNISDGGGGDAGVQQVDEAKALSQDVEMLNSTTGGDTVVQQVDELKEQSL
jgi:hypothetical protein